MAKDNEEKGRKRSSSRRERGDDKKKDSYKSKRSFTRNKTFRKGQTEGGRPKERPARTFEGGRRTGPGVRDGAEKRFKKDPNESGSTKSFKERRDQGGDERRSTRNRDEGERKFTRGGDRSAEARPYRSRRDDDKPFVKRESSRPRQDSRGDRDSRSKTEGAGRRTEDKDLPQRGGDKFERRPARFERSTDSRPKRGEAFKKSSDRGDRSQKESTRFGRRPAKFDRENTGRTNERDQVGSRTDSRGDREREDGPKFERRVRHDEFESGEGFKKKREPRERRDDASFKKTRDEKPSSSPKTSSKPNADGLIRLNKYLANAGVASRREADNLIQSGAVKVNGVVVDQLGYKIKPGDKVSYGDETVQSERKVYLLVNKPKDYITTVDDPRERKTVMELIEGACRERVYPVGRLDRNTTGLLLLTNDGELTTKLTHPKFGVKKIYHVSLNKGLRPEDYKTITEGLELEDGLIKVDDIAFVGEGKKEIGIEIHSGRNRIVRRLFEHLGYDVIKLDRVSFAGLTKKDLPRGKYRFLTAKEINFLKMIG